MKYKQMRIPAAVLLVGLVSVFSGLKICTPFDYFPLLNRSLWFSLPALLLFLVFFVKTGRQEGCSGGNYLYGILFSTVAFLIAGLGAVTFLNAKLGSGEPIVHSLTVIGKYACGSRTDNGRICAHVESWRKAGQIEKIQILPSDAKKVVPNSTQLDLVTRQGGLRFECLESYQIR